MANALKEKIDRKILDNWESFVTVVLSVLLTSSAAPAAAMGYKGADDQSKKDMKGKYFDTAQQDPNGKDLCIDHCAMHYPSDEMKKWVFENYLMSSDPWAFKHFGKWKN